MCVDRSFKSSDWRLKMKRIKIRYLFQYEVDVKTSIKDLGSQQRFTIQFNTQKPCKAR